MKLFIDSANIDEIKEVAGWGVISGVTTNPSLIAQEGRELRPLMNQICRIIDGSVTIQVMSVRTEEIIREAREYASWNPNITVSLPMSEKAIKATKILSSDGIQTYVSPFISNTDDTGIEGISLIKDIKTIFDQYVFDTQIITSSIRQTTHVTSTAKVGSDIASIPYSVLKQMFRHPLTDSGLKTYLEEVQSLNTFKVAQGV